MTTLLSPTRTAVKPIPVKPGGNRKLTKSARRTLRQRDPLDYELRTMGVDFLDVPSVRAYKDEQLDRLKNPEKYFVPDPVPSRVKPFMLRMISSLLVIGALALLTVFPAMRSHQVFCLVTLILTIMAFGLVWGSTEHDFYPSLQIPPSPRPQAEWQVHSLEKYQEKFPWQLIPKEELEKVRELRSRLPGVEFALHSLYADPFLEAIYTNPETGRTHRRFIGFWDEDTFVNPSTARDNYVLVYLPATPSTRN